MKKVILLFIILHSTMTSAQQMYGVEIGATFPWAERPDYSYYARTNGKNFKLSYQYAKKWYALKGSIGYLEKGFLQHLIFVDTSGNILGQGDVERHRFSYFTASAKAGYSTGEKIKFSALIGLEYGHYTHTSVYLGEVILDNGDTYPGYNLTFSNLKRPDLSANLELNLGVRFKETNFIFLITEYSHGLIKIKYKETATFNPWKNHYASLRIGLLSTINLKKDKPELAVPE